MNKQTNRILEISLLLGFSYLFLMGGQICAKFAGLNLGVFESISLVFAAGTYIFFFLRGFLWIFVLRRLKLVLAYPLMSIGYVLILFISRSLFDEMITPGKAGGSLLLITGVILVSIGEAKLSGGESE